LAKSDVNYAGRQRFTAHPSTARKRERRQEKSEKTMMRPEYLLLPANRAFIAFSLILAFLLNLLPWTRVSIAPDFVALVLVFWNVHQPRKVGMGLAFLFGLLMDVHDASLFGEHALSYTLLSFGAISLHRRILWFKSIGQMLHVFPLFLIALLATLIIRLFVGGAVPGWFYFVPAVTQALLWPVVSFLLLAPQRRVVEIDETRPI
jgi:rod shape-determining protein MreD